MIGIHACRYGHGVRPLQVCGEDERGYECGGTTREYGRSSAWVDILFGDGRCRDLPGTSGLHLLHVSVM